MKQKQFYDADRIHVADKLSQKVIAQHHGFPELLDPWDIEVGYQRKGPNCLKTSFGRLLSSFAKQCGP